MSTLVKFLLGIVISALGTDPAEVKDNTSEVEMINCEETVQVICPEELEAHYIISENELLSPNK